MAVKRLEERLTEYNILETGWEINYHEVMAGGQGRVYPVKKNIGNKVLIEAIKVISIPSEGEEQQWKYKSESTIKTQITKRKEEAKKEYEMLLELKGNHVIPVRDVLEKSFDLINEGDQLGYDIIIRMDYLSSLENYLFENNFQSFSNEEIVNCGIQICTALNCLHNRNMAHRDIKPGNIFVSKVSDGNLMFYLGDFGSVKESSMGLSIGRSRTISGTELYLAPYWENTQYRIQRDLYSLGLTLFWMATGGNLPYEETNCKEIMDDEREGAYIKRRISQKELPTGDINDKIASVIKKACSVKKEDEINIVPTSYINATQMRKALEKIKESKGQNVEKNIIKVEDECTEKVVSNLELTVSEERVKQQSVERIFTKQDYKGEQILVIGDEYTGIADYALQGTPIVELTIGASVKTFGRKIWANCKSLKKLHVENYETVYEGDFNNCNRLEEVRLPGCKKIGKSVFIGCAALEEIVLADYSGTGLQDASIKKLTLLECKIIDSYKFKECQNLQHIELPQCERVEDYGFSGCRNLRQINLPKCKKIGDYLFVGKKCGDGYDFKSIYWYLENIELPQCEEVGQHAFSGCASLRYINLPKCKRLGAGAFSGVYLLRNNGYDPFGIYDRDDMYDRCSLNFSACYKMEGVMLPQCEEVGNSAFSGCVSLRQINLPKCKRLGASAFSGCKYKYQRAGEFQGLESIEIPQCEEIGDSAFYKCDNLQTIKAVSCRVVGGSAFVGCEKLEIVELPKCEILESNAFRDCKELKKISIQKCKEISSCTFGCCESIEEIEMLECEKVGGYSFWKCHNLQKIIMPKCSEIGKNTFDECWNLKEVRLAKDANWSRVGFAVQKLKNKMRKKK